jgi:hypothetical protein
MANSINVGAFGNGGGGATGIPNGFLEPVWCDLTGWASGGDFEEDGAEVPRIVSGVEAGRVGRSAAVCAVGFWENGDDENIVVAEKAEALAGATGDDLNDDCDVCPRAGFCCWKGLG